MPRNYTYKCCFGCKKEEDVLLHRFPKALTEEKFQIWKSTLDSYLQTKSNSYIYNNLRICSNHFADCYRAISKRLTCNAIPTVNIASTSNSTLLINQPLLNKTTDVGFPHDELPIRQTVTKQKRTTATKHKLRQIIREESNSKEETSSSKPPDDINNDLEENIDHCDIDTEPILKSDASLDSALLSWNEPFEIVPKAASTTNSTLLINLQLLNKPTDVGFPHDELPSRQTITEQKRTTALKHKRRQANREDTTLEQNQTCSEKIHAGFQCTDCKKVIAGYRYTCLQCPNCDICSACERSETHAAHYVLRVPGSRLYNEVQSMLETIRRHLFHTDILLQSTGTDESADYLEDSVKVEDIKQETEDKDPFENIGEHKIVQSLPTNSEQFVKTPQEENMLLSNEEPSNSSRLKATRQRSPPRTPPSTRKRKLPLKETLLAKLKTDPSVVLSIIPLVKLRKLQKFGTKTDMGKLPRHLEAVEINTNEIKKLLESGSRAKSFRSNTYTDR